jgi:Family of unknown function (DUF6188)
MQQLNDPTNPINLDFLPGKELIQICVGRYQVILRFTDELEITLEGAYWISNAEEETFRTSGKDPTSSKYLVPLLGQTIKSAQVQQDDGIIINFSTGHILFVKAGSGDFESFSITFESFFILG